uniref:RNA-binding protein 42 n=1 Tax=Timema monikensis TaxID=170555 RepID=A0A7R9E8L8_9NEOP|nr:unnamed protein product [Timema monikensis]
MERSRFKFCATPLIYNPKNLTGQPILVEPVMEPAIPEFAVEKKVIGKNKSSSINNNKAISEAANRARDVVDKVGEDKHGGTSGPRGGGHPCRYPHHGQQKEGEEGQENNDFRIFCGDLGNDVTDEILTRAFSKYSSFLKAKVVRDKRTNKTKGFGFVSFKDPQDFIKAMKEMNGE